MPVALNSVYGGLVSGSAGSKLYVPVNKSALIYSHFDHVSGFAANKGQDGVSISKIRILNTLIDHLSAIKSGSRPASSTASTPEQIDSLIHNYQTQIKQAVEAAKTTPYMLAGVRPEAGELFSLNA